MSTIFYICCFSIHISFSSLVFHISLFSRLDDKMKDSQTYNPNSRRPKTANYKIKGVPRDMDRQAIHKYGFCKRCRPCTACFHLSLSSYHISAQRHNRNQNAIFSFVQRSCSCVVLCLVVCSSAASISFSLSSLAASIYLGIACLFKIKGALIAVAALFPNHVSPSAVRGSGSDQGPVKDQKQHSYAFLSPLNNGLYISAYRCLGKRASVAPMKAKEWYFWENIVWLANERSGIERM